jgi:hypothetical protein
MHFLGDSREEFCKTCESVTRQVLENQDVAGSLNAVAQRWWCLDGYHEWDEPPRTEPPAAQH